jgi:hypothetical protein
VSIVDFWNTIHESGDLLVAPPGGPSAATGAVDADAPLRAAVERVEADWRMELAFDPPTLIPAVALWAVELIYQACQCMVYREIDPDSMAAALAVPCPLPPQGAQAADVCYSADLGLRVLPDVLALARAVSPDDPLVLALREIARRWPLSSVGVQPPLESPPPLDVLAFINHPSLRRLYADRIIARGDASRLPDDDRVRAEVRAALGAHARELASSALATAVYGAERE